MWREQVKYERNWQRTGWLKKGVIELDEDKEVDEEQEEQRGEERYDEERTMPKNDKMIPSENENEKQQGKMWEERVYERNW